MGDLSLMYLYSLTYFINSLGFIVNKKNREILTLVTLVLLVFISGTRYYMGGSDVYVYENVYNGAPAVWKILVYIFTGINKGINENYEIGFLLICSIIKSMRFSYFGFTLVFAVLFYALVYKGLQDFVPNWAPFFALFMYKIMFYNTFISIRQGFTIAIFCYSLKYIRDKKWIQYFLLSYIAFTIHRGALIMFLLYFVQFIPLTKKVIYWTAILFAPTWLIREQINLENIMQQIIDIVGYEQKSEMWLEATEPISIIHTIECYIMVVLVLIFYDKIINNSRKREAQLVLRLFLVTIPVFTILSNWIVMTREKDYLVLMYGIIFGYILDGGTTSLRVRTNGVLDYRGISNYKIITILVITACFVGMTRYVMVFDGGVLSHFTSFITEGVSIFR